MQSFHAPSVHDLLRILGEVPIPERPPPREKRKTEYTEKWVIRYFFEAIAETGLLEYPLCVEHRDKPDVVLSSRIGKTGIEITEAVPKDRAKVEAWLGNKGNREMVPENWSELVADSEPDDLGGSSESIDIPGTRLVPPYHYGEERSKKEIEGIARKRDRTQDRPFMGDWIEQNWIEAMKGYTRHKAGKFALPGFATHDRNWLLIYDNWSPGIHGYHEVAKPLAQQLSNCEWRNPFEKIFILQGDGQTVWEFSRDAEIMKLHGPGHSRQCESTLGETEP